MPDDLRLRPTRREWCWLAIAAVLLAVQLFLPPYVGLADNGDQHRLAGPFGLEPADTEGISRDFTRLVHRFDLTDPGGGGYLSSQLLVVLGAVALSPFDGDLATLDLRLLGLLNAVLVLAAGWLVLAALRPLGRPARAVAGVGLLAIVTDGVSAAFLSSFYSEPATLWSLLAFVGLGLRWTGTAATGRSHWKLVLLASLLFLSAKQQNAPLGLLFAAALLLASRRGGRPLRIPREVVAGTAAVLVLAPLVYLSLTPPKMRANFTYHAVFRELAAVSPDPRGDLAALGLDPDLERYAGTTAYEQASGMRVPAVRNALDERIGVATLLRFYATHPDRLANLVRRGLEGSLASRPAGLGTFPEEARRPPGGVDRRFSAWSDAKAAASPVAPVLVPALLAAAVGAGIVAARRDDRREARLPVDARWLVLLGLAAVAQLAVVLLAEGAIDLARRLYLFHLLLDLSAWGTATLLVEATGRSLAARRDRHPSETPRRRPDVASRAAAG